MPLHGSITEEDRTFVETWENVSDATNYIVQEDRRGDEVFRQIGATTTTFRITTYERIITEERVVDPSNNPFKNGAFRPVKVPGHINIETNPNALSAADIRRLFEASEVAWEEYLRVIDSPATLKRMLELAEGSSLSLRRYRELEQLLAERSQSKRLTHPDPAVQAQIEAIPGAAREVTTPATAAKAKATMTRGASSSTQR